MVDRFSSRAFELQFAALTRAERDRPRLWNGKLPAEDANAPIPDFRWSAQKAVDRVPADGAGEVETRGWASSFEEARFADSRWDRAEEPPLPPTVAPRAPAETRLSPALAVLRGGRAPSDGE